jgi:hypothetical protein
VSYYVNYKNKTKQNIDLKVRLCTRDDFGPGDDADAIFSTWEGYYIICHEAPPEMDSVKLKGDLGSSESWRFYFKVSKCDTQKRRNLGLSDCAPNNEIEEWIRDLQIDVWYMQ